MRSDRSWASRGPTFVSIILALFGAAVLAGPVRAQLPGSLLPNPRLFTVMPSGGKAGTTFEVTFTGQDVEEPQALLFSQPSIKAELVVLPPADPKKPPAQPAVPKFKVTIPADAPIGIHDVRLVNKWGVSNPRAFVVGDLAEVLETEPNDDVDKAQRVEINTTINGVIATPTDVDYFVFAGKKGQRVVVSCLASSIDSRLNAAIELYSSAGRLLAANRNYHDTDALLDCTLPEDGDYRVRLYEFTHILGSAEHFYRLSITTHPWIDAVYPPMVEPGKTAKLTVFGRNLPGGEPDPSAVVDGRVLDKLTVTVEVPNDPAALHRLVYSGSLSPVVSGTDGFEYRLRTDAGVSNPFLLTYARAPIVLDNEANDTPETAQEVTVPSEIAGRIEKKGDRDWYMFTAKQGQVYSIELYSQRLGLPTDLKFTLRNPATKQDIGEFDDNPDTLTPLKFTTQTSDPPAFRFVVPADGKYQVMVTSLDSDTLVDARHLYRLRITPEQPDFRLIVLPPDDNRPDACALRQGGQQFYQVLAWRREGWNGAVNLSIDGLPKGVTCPPQVLGPGLKQATLVVSAAADAPPATGEIQIKGTATINGQNVVREARAANIVWPVVPGQGIPPLCRLDRRIVLAVRDKAPFGLAASIDKATLFHGDKATLSLKLTRLWPDFKQPLQLLLIPGDLPANLIVNNNQPANIAPNADSAALPVVVNPAVPPGTYNLVLLAQSAIPFNKDPKAAQKPPINIAQVSAPVVITVLPKQVATLTLANPSLTIKAGTQAEAVVKVSRMYEFAGEFKVQVVLPPAAKGITIDDVTIPAGKDEAKFIVKVAADVAPGNRPDLVVRATALVNGNVPTVHETKLNVNVVK
jgi:hypothetical protein